jgi:hypothetical protein
MFVTTKTGGVPLKRDATSNTQHPMVEGEAESEVRKAAFLRAFLSCSPEVINSREHPDRRLCSPEVTGHHEHLSRRLDDQIPTPPRGPLSAHLSAFFAKITKKNPSESE